MAMEMALQQFMNLQVLQQVEPLLNAMEPIGDIIEDALEKIRIGKFNKTAADEFGNATAYYLSCSPDLLEPHFIVYLGKFINDLMQENINYACSALHLLYKAPLCENSSVTIEEAMFKYITMSIIKMATYFSNEDGIMVLRCNVACQQLVHYLLFTISLQKNFTYMVNITQLFNHLQILAKQNVKENPAFCFILCKDMCSVCQIFITGETNRLEILGELFLLMSRSALNGKAFDLAMKHCKHAAETIYEYENSEAFLIWAEALELKGNISAAIEKAQLAVKQSKNDEERQKSQDFLDKLHSEIVEQMSSAESEQLDESWLDGTNVLSNEVEKAKAKAVKDTHVTKKKRSRRTDKRKRTDSNCSSSMGSANTSLKQISDMSTWTSKRFRQISSSSNSSGFSTSDPIPPRQPSQGPHFDDHDIERFLSHRNCESSSDEDEVSTDDEPEDPLFHESIDEDAADDDDDDDDDMNSIVKQCESENPDQTWFEESKETFKSSVIDETNPKICIGFGLNLDEHHVAKFINSSQSNSKRKPFYRDFIPKDCLLQLVKDEPNTSRYKKCKIELESAHKATCKVLETSGFQNDIEISGRSKCGQSFNNDEVVVEILFDPKENHEKKSPSFEADSKPFGKVVGVLNSHFLKNSQHPILACTSNETDGWLMRPLCKSIPKIHVINTVTKSKSPNLTKYRIDQYEVVGSELKYKGKFDINPVLRGQYVFIIVYLGWGSKHVYPLGAVLDVLHCGRDFNSGLRILEMQYKVPSLFPHDAISQIQTIVDQNGKLDGTRRDDRTNDLVFTIDPPQSKDLDDALSIIKDGNNYVVGVHIADVASVVMKGDAVDKEARKRAVSFYIHNKRTRHMLPEPLSQDICSLVPEQKRPALSVFFTFNPEGKIVKEAVVKRTIIKSCKQFSYEEVQKIIEKEQINEPSQIEASVRNLHNLAQKIRKQRLKDARLSVPFEDARFCDMEAESNCVEAHALVEEFMIETNTAIAKFVKKQFPRCLPLRCQMPPANEEVQKWLKEEQKFVDLLVHLQGKEVIPNNVISALNGVRKCANQKTDFIPIQSDIWKSILDGLENRRFSDVKKMVCTDEIHPLQNLAWLHWIKLLDSAEYRCSGVTNSAQASHFSLGIQPYIHFTSPIRRYIDLVSHRLVHAILSDEDCPYTVDDIQDICDDVNEATTRQKQFDKSCQVLAKTEKMGKCSMVFHGIVDAVTENGLELSLPGMRTVPSKCKEVRFCLLDLRKKPEMKKDTKTNKDLVVCHWKKRLYDTTGCPTQVIFNQSHNQPLELMIVEPNQHTVLVRFQDWANILKGTFENNSSAVQRTTRRLVPSGDIEPVSSFKGVDVVTSETGHGIIKSHQCRFSLSMKPGQVLKVQLGASPNNGRLLPQVELVHITKNLCLCQCHMDDPVGILSKYATCSVKQKFSSIEEYKKAWMPLLEMEAALSAVSNEINPIINNVAFTFAKSPISGKITGSFQLSGNFCDERNIEFGGLPVERLKEEKQGCKISDYLCIRCFVPGPPGSRCRDVENGMTWVGHAQTISAILKKKQSRNGDVTTTGSLLDNDKVIVKFVLNDKCAPPPASLMLESKITGTLELICKKEMDRRTQITLQNLGTTSKSNRDENKLARPLAIKTKSDEGKLARTIALSEELPKIPKCRKDIVKEMEEDVVGDEDVPLPKNNVKQKEAIQNALTKSFSLIQGPPGTGKTYTGIKLVYLFNKINAEIRANGGEKCQVLFCGPSNKSVDMVAWYLIDRLGNACPKIIRMYGSNIVSQDYPIPNRDLISKHSLHDLKSDPRLKDYTLHHVIRQRGDYAKDIKTFDTLFTLMLKKTKSNEEVNMINKFVRAIQLKQTDLKNVQTDPDKANRRIIKLYLKLVYKAYAEELQKCEVILCTCSVGGNENLVGGTKIYQCIIDEAAMCPEPLAMVPIIATNAQQVVLIGDHKQLRPIIQSSQAAELGLEQSLFERYSKDPSVLTFLNTQYRMHPAICAFPSKQFYGGQLKTVFSRDEPNVQLLPDNWVPHVFCHVEGLEEILTVSTEEGNEQSRSNMAEIDKVVEIYRWLIEKKADKRVTTRVPSKDIAVLSQYNSQVSVIKAKLGEYMDPNNKLNPEGPRLRKLNVSTVVSSQGGEWDYVIFSTVRSLPSYKIEPAPTLGWCKHNLGFITDANQINVALTRARKGLIIVGNMHLLRADQVWKNLIDSYERKGCLITDPKDFPIYHRRRRQRQPLQF